MQDIFHNEVNVRKCFANFYHFEGILVNRIVSSNGLCYSLDHFADWQSTMIFHRQLRKFSNKCFLYFQLVTTSQPSFLAIHCQECGGKKSENNRDLVHKFVKYTLLVFILSSNIILHNMITITMLHICVFLFVQKMIKTY